MAPTDDAHIHGAGGVLRTFPKEGPEFAYLCHGKKMKFTEKGEKELRDVLGDLTLLPSYAQAQHLTLATIRNEHFMFVAFNAEFQSREVRVNVPAEVAKSLQAAYSKDIPAEHLDESNTSATAARDRAIKRCTFARDLTLKDVEGWAVCDNPLLKFESPALALHEVSDDEGEEEQQSQEEEEQQPPEPAPRKKKKATVDLDDSDEEGSDRTRYKMPDGSMREMAVRSGRHVYRLHKENIASKVGKPIVCTRSEFDQMRGKGKIATDQKLHFRHPTLLSGYSVDGAEATMPYVHYLITDEGGIYNDPKYCILYNMQKLHLSEDGQMQKMRDQAAAAGRNPDDYPALCWKIDHIGKGSQLAVTKSGMKTVNDKILPGPVKKSDPCGEASTALCKRSANDEGGYDMVQKKVRLPELDRGATSVFVVPPGHSIRKQKEGGKGQVYFTLYHNADSSEEEEEEE